MSQSPVPSSQIQTAAKPGGGEHASARLSVGGGGVVRLPETEPAAGEVYLRLDQSRGSPYARSEYARKLLWRVVRLTLWRVVGSRGRAGLLRLLGGDVHPTTNIRPSVKVHHPWLLRTGAWSSLGDNVNVYNLGPILIGTHTTISQNVHLCAGSHDWRDPSMPLTRPPITIGAGCWVCADAFIGPGVRVGNNCVVAARAVVVKDVPDCSIVGGNPAKVIGVRTPPRA